VLLALGHVGLQLQVGYWLAGTIYLKSLQDLSAITHSFTRDGCVKEKGQQATEKMKMRRCRTDRKQNIKTINPPTTTTPFTILEGLNKEREASTSTGFPNYEVAGIAVETGPFDLWMSCMDLLSTNENEPPQFKSQALHLVIGHCGRSRNRSSKLHKTKAPHQESKTLFA
jgi:hypothetical protein